MTGSQLYSNNKYAEDGLFLVSIMAILLVLLNLGYGSGNQDLYSKWFPILNVTAFKAESAELASPVLGFMDGRVKESMNAKLQVELISKKDGKIIFSDTGRNSGLEIAGKTEELLKF